MIDGGKFAAAMSAIGEIEKTGELLGEAKRQLIRHEEELLTLTGWKKDASTGWWWNESIGESEPAPRSDAVDKTKAALLLAKGLLETKEPV